MSDETPETIPETIPEPPAAWLAEVYHRLDTIDFKLAQIRDDGDLARKERGHIDEQLHEVRQFITRNQPLIERAEKLMHPGGSVRELLAARKGSRNHD